MLCQRILVLGCSGSGKSTFARRLSELMGLPVVHLDKLYHLPGWVPRPQEEFDQILMQELEKDAWIIDGNYTRTLPLRLGYCDTVIFFDVPRLVSMWGILSRVLKTRGGTRPDMADGCRDHLNWEFMKFTWNFEKTQGAENRSLIYSCGKPVVMFRSRREARQYLEGLQQRITGR